MDPTETLKVPHIREIFYINGEYTTFCSPPTTPQSVLATDTPTPLNHWMINQIYVEKLVPFQPPSTQPYPLIFIAGAGQTGTNFLTTPDGRPGWASFFLAQGYTVYLTDQPSRGRSAGHPSLGALCVSSTSDVERNFTACSSHKLWPRSTAHTQWPGSGKRADPVFDTFFASQVPFLLDRKLCEAQNTSAYTKLLDRVGEAYLITHSQAGPFGWRVGDARPNLVRGIVALEPGGPPFEMKFPMSGYGRAWGITDLEIEYEPSAGLNAEFLQTKRMPARDNDSMDYVLQKEPAKKLKNLSRVQVLVVTGEASYHAPYDYGTVAYLRQTGVQAEHLELWREGIRGNGHMFFMEKNNLDIAQKVLAWLTARDTPGGAMKEN